MTAKTGKKTAAPSFTAEERAAMKERAREAKAEARAGASREDGEKEVLAKIAAMADADRVLAGQLHHLITTTTPALVPRLWYGMPAYALGGKVVCFFQDAQKFKTRYSTLGFSDAAKLDDGEMWPTTYAVKELTVEGETRIVELVKKAVG